MKYKEGYVKLSLEEIQNEEERLLEHLKKEHGYNNTTIFYSSYVAVEELMKIHVKLHEKEVVE